MITIMSDGDEGQTGLQEVTMNSLNNQTPKNTEQTATNFSDQSSKYFDQQSTNTFHGV